MSAHVTNAAAVVEGWLSPQRSRPAKTDAETQTSRAPTPAQQQAEQRVAVPAPQKKRWAVKITRHPPATVEGTIGESFSLRVEARAVLLFEGATGTDTCSAIGRQLERVE